MIPLHKTSSFSHVGASARGLSLVVLTLLVSACLQNAPSEVDTQAARQEAAVAWADSVVSTMSLEEQIGQMIVIGMPDVVNGFDPDDFEALLETTVDFGAGGIVFLRTEPLSQATITADLQAASRIPMLVAQDMEWGAAMRVQHAIAYPQAMGIGATGNPEFAELAGRYTATEARALGVNMILAPVADVNSNPDNPIIATRSFGDDPVHVASYVRAFVKGVQEAGLLATTKHFPGHGSTDRDSHATLPRISPERFRTNLLDLRPFVASIDVGVAAIMTGHLAIAEKEATAPLPATLSDSLLTTVLRQKLGFDGLIISDALNMAGVGSASEADSVTIKAVLAGVDLLLMPLDPVKTRDTILRAVHNGSIPPMRIRTSAHRILKTKWLFDLHSPPQPRIQDIRSILTGPAHRGFAKELARNSLVLFDENSVLDTVRGAQSVSLIPIVDGTTGESLAQLTTSLNRFISNVNVTASVTRSPTSAALNTVSASIESSDVVLIADLSSERGSRAGTVTSVLDALSGSPSPTIFLGMGSPYNLRGATNSKMATLFSFGSAPSVIDAMVEAVFGRAKICGKLPIQINDLYQRGSGLCREQELPREGLPEEIGMSSTTIREMRKTIRSAIADSAFPGAAMAVGRAGGMSQVQGFGYFTYDSEQRVRTNSIYDLASLTKVVATTTALMTLYEEGRIRLDDTVGHYLPEFRAAGKDAVTIRHLLTHTGGLIPFRPFYRSARVTRASVINDIMQDSLQFEPGALSRYSDLGPIVLALIVEHVTGMPFEQYTRERIFEPLQMQNTGYRSVRRPGNIAQVVPTEVDNYFRNRLIQGVVHDETAYVLGGVAGHAGLFSTVEDLARFADMMVNEGKIGNKSFLKPETIRLFTQAVDSEGMHTRALGWDTKSMTGYSSAGSHFGRLSYGHTGFTGTSLWIDPDQKMYVILLTNRVYPTRDNSKHVPIRPAIANLAFEAIRYSPRPFPLSNVTE